MGKIGSFFSLALATALLATACSSGGGGPSATPAASGSGAPVKTITIGSDTSNDHGDVAVSGQSSLAMEQDDFYFDPTVLTGSAGQTLTIHLTNNGTVSHTFTSDVLKIDEVLSPGQKMDITVTFPSTGFTEFYCRFHRSQGMTGELTIS